LQELFGKNAKGVIGVAVWDDVDANARNCTIFVKGLSNAWSLAGDAVRRKVLKVSFKRVDNEMIPTGPAEWVYRTYKRPAENNPENPQLEIEQLLRQLTERIADLEVERQNWKEERRRRQDQIRALRHQAEEPAPDLKPDDRAIVVREARSRILELEREIAAGDRQETSRQEAMESYKQRGEQLRRLLLQLRDQPSHDQRKDEP
jgi:hypothetical protein